MSDIFDNLSVSDSSADIIIPPRIIDPEITDQDVIELLTKINIKDIICKKQTNSKLYRSDMIITLSESVQYVIATDKLYLSLNNTNISVINKNNDIIINCPYPDAAINLYLFTVNSFKL